MVLMTALSVVTANPLSEFLFFSQAPTPATRRRTMPPSTNHLVFEPLRATGTDAALVAAGAGFIAVSCDEREFIGVNSRPLSKRPVARPEPKNVAGPTTSRPHNTTDNYERGGKKRPPRPEKTRLRPNPGSSRRMA